MKNYSHKLPRLSFIKSNVLALLSLICFIPVCRACNCALVFGEPIDQPGYKEVLSEQIMSSHPTVFHGKVTMIAKPHSRWGSDVRIKVIRVYKGDLSSQVTVNNSKGTNCSYGFQVGKDYLIYAWQNERDQSLFTDQCSPTKLFSNPIVRKDLQVLGEGKAPRLITKEQRQFIIVALLMIFSCGLLIWKLKRKRDPHSL